MDTHIDSQHTRDWFEKLKAAADKNRAEGKSRITGGRDGEEILSQWDHGGVSVRHLPDDEHGILRISIGGGQTPVPLNYLVFRGDHTQCVDLLRKALAALENPS